MSDSDNDSVPKVTRITELRAQRGVVTMQQTKLKTFVDTKSATATAAEIETRLGLCESYFDNFERIQTLIEGIDESEISLDKRDIFTETYCYIKSRLIDAKAKKTPQPRASVDLSQSFASFRSRQPLPKIELPKFSGKLIEWPDFYNMFQTLVDKCDDLTPVEKLQHLKASLTGSARQTLQSIEITAENYSVALRLLRARFDNKRLVFQTHISELFKLEFATKGTAEELRRISDSINAHLRALLSLGSKEQISDCFLIHLLCQRMDAATISKWEDEAPLDAIPTWEEMESFLKKRCQALENSEGAIKSKTRYQPGNKSNSKSKAALITACSESKCLLCKNNNHDLVNCSQFLRLDPHKRYFEAKRMRLCIVCLKPGHLVKRCKAARCEHCHLNHHNLLHMPESKPSSTTKEIVPNIEDSNYPRPSTSNSCLTSSSKEDAQVLSDISSNEVLLGTALIQVRDHYGNFVTCRAVLDSASQNHFITEHLWRRLRLNSQKYEGSIDGIGLTSTPVKCATHLEVKSCINDFRCSLEAIVLPRITDYHPSRFVNISSWNVPSNLRLADPKFNSPQRVDILIGAELLYDLLCVGQIKLGQGKPILQKTLLGWIVAGGSSSSLCTTGLRLAEAVGEDGMLEELVERFWEVERHDLPAMPRTDDETRCEEHFNKTVRRLTSGRFVVCLPFRDNPQLLGSSFEIAKRRFHSLERKLERDEELRLQYSSFMSEYLTLGHMIPVDLKRMPARMNFLPHHGVRKAESSTTKLRVVFDASATTSSGHSLNDVLLKGPKLQDDLFDLLIRFRIYQFVFTADISKMYRQVLMDDKDTFWQCILWRDSPHEALQIFRLVTITYGTAPASFLAVRTLHQLA